MTKPQDRGDGHHRQLRSGTSSSYTDKRGQPHQTDIDRQLYCACERSNPVKDSTDVPNNQLGYTQIDRFVCLKCGREIKETP
jgi:hypothetical protein